MKRDMTILFEHGGVWYFQGTEIKMGFRLKIDGLSWKVVGFGRSPGESLAPYLWLQHERRGTIVYAPALHDVSPVIMTQWRETVLTAA